MKLEQGDIIKVENSPYSFLVVSKNFFNKTKQAILCPIVIDTHEDPLHIKIATKDVRGLVMCEQMKIFDLNHRGYKKIGRIAYSEVTNITDAIQSIFDY